jgi:hypothetical protein
MSSSFQQFMRESPYFPLCGGALFVAFAVLIIFMVSRASGGWHAFASRYPAPAEKPAGKLYDCGFSSFGLLGSHYASGGVRITFSDRGLYFQMRFPLFHRPFLLPWQSVKRIEKKAGLLGEKYHVDIEDAVGEIHFSLPGDAENDLRKYGKAA